MVLSQNENRSGPAGRDPQTSDVRTVGHLPRIWTGPAVAAATLAMGGNIVGLLAVD